MHSLARQSSSYASPGGTETLSRRYSTLKFNRHRDLRLSPVGFGAFRLNASKSKVLDYALSKGVNLIDTGSHFERGNSERVIGQVLRERFKTSDLQRDQVVIVSKSGYMDAESISSLQNVRKAELGNGLCHSLDPEYLAADLTRSLDRLGLDSLDVYMLNNPERMLAAKNRSFRSEDVLDMVYTAMAHIGKEIKKGRVQSFGICSNSMADPSAKDYIPIDSIIKEAKRQGLNKHFSMIEFPLNIFERDAVRSTEECPNLLQLAQVNIYLHCTDCEN